jgi:hypothetical protein
MGEYLRCDDEISAVDLLHWCWLATHRLYSRYYVGCCDCCRLPASPSIPATTGTSTDVVLTGYVLVVVNSRQRQYLYSVLY